MTQIVPPCKKCEERHEACHDTCPKFREFRKTLDEANERKRKVELKDRLYYSHEIFRKMDKA